MTSVADGRRPTKPGSSPPSEGSLTHERPRKQRAGATPRVARTDRRRSRPPGEGPGRRDHRLRSKGTDRLLERSRREDLRLDHRRGHRRVARPHHPGALPSEALGRLRPSDGDRHHHLRGSPARGASPAPQRRHGLDRVHGVPPPRLRRGGLGHRRCCPRRDGPLARTEGSPPQARPTAFGRGRTRQAIVGLQATWGRCLHTAKGRPGRLDLENQGVLGVDPSAKTDLCLSASARSSGLNSSAPRWIAIQMVLA